MKSLAIVALAVFGMTALAQLPDYAAIIDNEFTK